MKINFLENSTHDKIFGFVSHFPQFISHRQLTQVQIVADYYKPISDNTESSDSLNDSLKPCPVLLHRRLSKSNPNLWESIFKFNKQVLNRIETEFAQNYPIPFDEFEIEHIKQINRLKKFKKYNYLDKVPRYLVEVCLVYLKIVPDQYIEYAGSGFTDFIQPIFASHT